MAKIGSKTYDLFKVEKILIGDPSLDLDEAQMDEIGKEFIVPGSVVMTKPASQTTNIETEGDSSYRTLKTGADPTQVEFGVYGLELKNYPMFFGGTHDAVNDTWDAPDGEENIYKSIVIYTGETDTNGSQLKAIFPYVNVTAAFDGSLTKDAIKAVKATCYANKPVGMTLTTKFRLAKV